MSNYNQLHSRDRCHYKIKNKLRCPALLGGPYRRGVIERIFTRNPKKPNSAKRKVAKSVVRITKRRVDSRLVGIGEHSLQKFSQILLRGGRSNDVPGVRYTIFKGKFDFHYREGFTRMKRRSIYGIPRNRQKF